MANTQLQIINKALVLCGAATVTSITDGSPNAVALGNVYELALQSILSECKWNFCTIRYMPPVVPVGAPNYPTFLMPGEVVVYQLPSNVIRIWMMNPSNARVREESGLLISDTVNLGMFYTFYDDNPNDYPSYFLDAFIDKLCSDISYVIINSASIASEFVKKYETFSLPKAMSRNSQTGVQQVPKDGHWVNAKFYNDGTYDPSIGAVAN